MGKLSSLFLGAVFCFFFWSLGFCQTVVLKSGQTVEGEIIEQTDKYVKVAFEGLELIFYNDEISSIEQTPLAGPNSVTPQMESLYKAYTASLKTPKKEEAKEAAKPATASQEGFVKPAPVNPPAQAIK